MRPTVLSFCFWFGVNGNSDCTGLDREKYSTLHTCGTKILPGQEDGMVVVLGVVGVPPLLGVGPATHLLQAPGRVPTLNQADGLAEENTNTTAQDLDRWADPWMGGRMDG